MKAQKILRRKIAVALLVGMLLTAPPLSLTAEAQSQATLRMRAQPGETEFERWERLDRMHAEARRDRVLLRQRTSDRQRWGAPPVATPPPVKNNGTARPDLRY
jgi:hypothetical protein